MNIPAGGPKASRNIIEANFGSLAFCAGRVTPGAAIDTANHSSTGALRRVGFPPIHRGHQSKNMLSFSDAVPLHASRLILNYSQQIEYSGPLAQARSTRPNISWLMQTYLYRHSQAPCDAIEHRSVRHEVRGYQSPLRTAMKKTRGWVAGRKGMH